MRQAVLPTLALFGALLALPGCAVFSDAPHYRGVAVPEHALKELTPGISTQADVQALLGPPTFQEQFAPNVWVYVSQITKMRIANTEGVKAQHVVTISFDNNGVLTNIGQKDLQDGVEVAMDKSQTPVPGGHAGFIQQLIGGVGSYNPGIGNTTGAGGIGAGAGGLGGGAGDIGGAGGGGGF